MSVSQLAWLKYSCSALISSNGPHDYWEKAGLYYQELRAMVVNKDLVGGVIKLIRYTSFSFKISRRLGTNQPYGLAGFTMFRMLDMIVTEVCIYLFM